MNKNTKLIVPNNLTKIIIPGRKENPKISRKEQKQFTKKIKKLRILGFLPFVQHHE